MNIGSSFKKSGVLISSRISLSSGISSGGGGGLFSCQGITEVVDTDKSLEFCGINTDEVIEGVVKPDIPTKDSSKKEKLNPYKNLIIKN